MNAAPNQSSKFGRSETKPQQANCLDPSKLSSCLNDLKLSWRKKGIIAGLWHDWPKLAGKQIASNCRPLSLRRGILLIGASHPQWRQALQYNRPQLLAALKAAGHAIREIRIQQYHPSQHKAIDSEQSIWERHPSRTDVHGMANCYLCGSPAPAGEMALWGKCSFCRRKELEN